MNRLLLLLAAGGFLTGVAQAQIGSVRSWRKINDVVGGFGGALSFYDLFGANVAALGDVDGDGIPDLAASAEGDDDGGSATGAVYVLHLDTDGSVQEERKISNLHGGLGSVLDAGDAFGSALTALGDLDGDGLTDLAVGAPGDDDGGPDRGAVWILFLSPGGGVRASQKISTTSGGFGGALANRDIFGASLARIGDLDGDGVTDLAVGSPWNDDGGFSTGAVWILFLNPDGTVKAEQKISATTGGFVGPLLQASYFAGGLGTLGDFDGDGRPDLAVGATGDHDGGGFGYRGALWILLLNPDGTVKGEQKISATSGGFGGELDTYDGFGAHIAPLGDLDLDGTPDLAVGALGDDEGDTDQGAYWILFLAPDGTVARELKVAEGVGGFGGNLIVEDGFGSGIAPLGDLDGDGVSELAVGARESGTNDHGAVWILFLDGCFALDFELEDDFETQLQNGQHLNTEFGRRLTLASSGSNAGLALFDSTPGGPNDPSQDRDLLVDSGNVLIFQTENAPPDANDVFPLPNDDEDGGTLSMAFMLPVRLERLDLIDIDASEDTSTLVLTDAAGLTRTFSVPADWTGDLLLGQPGRGTLDLTTLEPQLGFGSVATAVEEPGFDPAAVVSLELQLGGSGALDDLRVCPVRTLAAATARNGSGQNPMNLRTSDRPVLGRTWRASLDCARGFSGLAVIEVRRRALAGSRFPFGELLIGGGLLQRVVQPYTFAGSPTDLILSVPPDLSLCGFEACVQGLCSDTLPASPGSKSLGARARLSNALDLVFGFQ